MVQVDPNPDQANQVHGNSLNEPRESSLPAYGALSHYLGAEGASYFEWQGANGGQRALYNLHIWLPHVRPGHDVLDFGCGGGFLLKALGGGRRVGIEINPRAAAMAAANGVEVYSGLEAVTGHFDRILSSHALEHVPHPREALAQLRDRLRDAEARLLLLLPLDDWRRPDQRRFHRGDINQHLHTWTPQLLGNLLESVGLVVHRIDLVTHAWPPGGDRIWAVSPAAFHLSSRLWSVISRRRQLFAVAGRPA